MTRLSALLALAACGAVKPPATDGGGDDGSTVTVTVATGRQFVRDGATLAVDVGVARADVTGAVAVTAALPAGVTADPLAIPDGADHGTLVLHADAAAPFGRTAVAIGGAIGDVHGTATLDLDVIGAPGALDPGFGTAGAASFTIPAVTSLTSVFATAQDDRVIAVFAINGTSVAIARFAHDGTLDGSFGENGVTVLELSTIGLSSLSNVAAGVQSDGRLVVAGSAYNGTDHDPFIARLTRDGALDATLSLRRLDTATPDDYLRAVAIGPHDEIVLAGERSTAAQAGDALVIRTSADGVRDAGFGSNGSATLHDATLTTFAAAAVQADGRIVVVSSAVPSGALFATYTLRRFGTDGQRDLAFGTSGTAALSTPSGLAGANALVAIDGADLVVTGAMRVSGLSAADDAIWRYLATGALDTSFGGLGFFGPTTADIDSLGPAVIDADHGIYAAGTSTAQALGPLTLHVVHVDATGAADPGFADPGAIANPVVLAPTSLVMRADHRLVVMGSTAGLTTTPTSTAFRAYFY
jgi:uncharacterized delta-60 repeat protein